MAGCDRYASVRAELTISIGRVCVRAEAGLLEVALEDCALASVSTLGGKVTQDGARETGALRDVCGPVYRCDGDGDDGSDSDGNTGKDLDGIGLRTEFSVGHKRSAVG